MSYCWALRGRETEEYPSQRSWWTEKTNTLFCTHFTACGCSGCTRTGVEPEKWACNRLELVHNSVKGKGTGRGIHSLGQLRRHWMTRTKAPSRCATNVRPGLNSTRAKPMMWHIECKLVCRSCSCNWSCRAMLPRCSLVESKSTMLQSPQTKAPNQGLS